MVTLSASPDHIYVTSLHYLHLTEMVISYDSLIGYYTT